MMGRLRYCWRVRADKKSKCKRQNDRAKITNLGNPKRSIEIVESIPKHELRISRVAAMTRGDGCICDLLQ